MNDEQEIRQIALELALGMTYRSDLGEIDTLNLQAVLNAAAAFELFMIHGESAVPNGGAF